MMTDIYYKSLAEQIGLHLPKEEFASSAAAMLVNVLAEKAVFDAVANIKDILFFGASPNFGH